MDSKVLPGALLCGALISSAALAERAPVPAAAPVLELTTVPGVADSAGHARPRESSRLDAGSLVEIRWSGVPAAADEVELLLSVDGGRTYSLRLTDELEAGDGTWLWTVPRLDTSRARLAIRMSVDGSEVIAATSRPFRIAPSASAPRIRLRWKSGEIWAESDGAAESDRPLSDADLSGSPETLTALSDAVDAAELPRRIASHAIAVLEARREVLAPPTLVVRSSLHSRSSPRAVPQRL